MTHRGYPRIEYCGYNFGVKTKKSNKTTWTCTITKNKKRCTASLQTIQIDGVTMMKVMNPYHTICHKIY